jgi:hypothetical protein
MPDAVLRLPDPFQVMKWFPEEFQEPFPSARCAGEVEAMENRELFFGMKDRKVQVCILVYLHNYRLNRSLLPVWDSSNLPFS